MNEEVTSSDDRRDMLKEFASLRGIDRDELLNLNSAVDYVESGHGTLEDVYQAWHRFKDSEREARQSLLMLLGGLTALIGIVIAWSHFGNTVLLVALPVAFILLMVKMHISGSSLSIPSWQSVVRFPFQLMLAIMEVIKRLFP